ncbi:MAG TPA: sterol desaturase family protein [Parasegetibacter sp.]|jgi:lathosterol oxidase
MNDLLKEFAGQAATALLRYYVIAGIAFVVFYLLFAEVLHKNKIQERYASKKDFRREVLNSSVSAVILATVAFLASSKWIAPYTLIYTDKFEYPLWWMPVSVFLSLVIHDTYFYWMHRLLHHPALFKFTHLLHHKSTNPSPWTAYSFHVLEAVAEGAVVLVLVFVIPLHPVSISMFALAALLINVYGHLGYEIAPKWFRKSFLFEFVNTSTYHNLHHSKFKGNYGLYFRVWDRLLGTEHPDYVKIYDRIQEKRFGNEGTVQPSPIAANQKAVRLQQEIE